MVEDLFYEYELGPNLFFKLEPEPIEILGQVREKPRLFNSRDESEQSLSQSPKHLSSIFKIIFING